MAVQWAMRTFLPLTDAQKQWIYGDTTVQAFLKMWGSELSSSWGQGRHLPTELSSPVQGSAFLTQIYFYSHFGNGSFSFPVSPPRAALPPVNPSYLQTLCRAFLPHVAEVPGRSSPPSAYLQALWGILLPVSCSHWCAWLCFLHTDLCGVQSHTFHSRASQLLMDTLCQMA